MKKNNTNGFYVRGNTIYVRGSIDGIYLRYSTRKKATKINLAYIKANWEVELHKLHGSHDENKHSDLFIDHALMTLEFSNKKRKTNTAKEYNQIFEKRIRPYFENFKLEDIKRSDLMVWQQNLVDQGLSGKRVNNIRSVFNFILEEARKNELIDKNYFSLIDREKESKVEVNPFSMKEVQLILSKATGWEKDFIQFSFFTGLRTGEAIALSWDDINFASNTITIRKGVRKGVLGSTKTDEIRTIDLLPPAKEALLNMKQRTFLRSSFIFLSPTGSHFYDGSIIRNGVWKNALKLSGLDYRSLYTTRHTFASIMISEGEDISWVSNMLGHADLQITLKRYAKFIKTEKKVRAKFLNKFDFSNLADTQTENCVVKNKKNNNLKIRKTA